MEFFIKKVFDGNIDDLVKLQFQKFGRGNFENKASITAKMVKGRFDIKTTHEYANELVRAVAEILGSDETNVSGVMVSTLDLSGELEYKSKSQFMGVKKYAIGGLMTGDKIIDLCERFPKCFMGISFKAGDTELKIKPKAPKSGKPSTKEGEGPAVDFCKLKTANRGLAKGLLFDVDLDNFKSAGINHTFVIEDIEVPDVEDPVKMRELAVRKGKIIRNSVVDGVSVKEEKDFRI